MIVTTKRVLANITVIKKVRIIKKKKTVEDETTPTVVKQHDLYLSKDYCVDCWNGLEGLQRKLMHAFNYCRSHN